MRACQSGSVVDVVVKAIDLARPVANLGGESLPFMATSWKRSGTASAQLDGDAVASLWRPSNLASPPPGEGCPGTANITTGSGTAVLVVGCGLVTRSLEARTLNVFRFPLAITVANVTIDRDAAISIGLVSRTCKLFARAHAQCSTRDREIPIHSHAGLDERGLSGNALLNAITLCPFSFLHVVFAGGP